MNDDAEVEPALAHFYGHAKLSEFRFVFGGRRALSCRPCPAVMLRAIGISASLDLVHRPPIELEAIKAIRRLQ
jgi:hypothetical protein